MTGGQGDIITFAVLLMLTLYIIVREGEVKQQPGQLQTQSQRARRAAVRQF